MKHFIYILLCIGTWLNANAKAPVSLQNCNNLKQVTNKMPVQKSRFDRSIQRMQSQPQKQLSDQVASPREFFKRHNVTPDDNRLSKRVPRRLTEDDVMSKSYVDFRYVYTFNYETGDIEPSDYFYRGGLGCNWTTYDGMLYCDGLVENDCTGEFYYLPVDIDYSSGEVWIPTGYVLQDDSIEGNYSATTRLKTDTLRYFIFVDTDWYMGNSNDFSDVGGRMYMDGSIEFNDTLGYMLVGYEVINNYKRTSNSWSGYNYILESSDTTYVEDIYYGTQFLASNSVHDYDVVSSSPYHQTDDIYMFQYDDDAIAVFNLYGLGMPYMSLYIDSDGTMRLPLDQPAGEIGSYEKSIYQEYFSDYNWDEVRWYQLVNAVWDEDQQDYAYTYDSEAFGTVTTTSISWDAMYYWLTGLYYEGDGEYYVLTSYPFINNVLSFTDGSEIILPEVVNPYLRGDVNNDGVVNLNDVVTLIDHLMVDDFDDSDEFSGDNSDTNLDGTFSITDVVVLIDYIVNDAWNDR